MRNFAAINAGEGGTGDYAEYLLKEEALKKSSEYYVEGEKTATTSVYIGSKSAKLGLHGEISLEAAKELLAGYTPDGTRIRGEKTSGEEILAHDNTLSAPKSVSIHCAEDIRLLDCHIAAVQQTIAALEKHYCVQRIQTNGIRTLEKGDGFVGWMTHHWTSRESEIDLHTHVITMNGCEGPDGKWRAVEDHQMSKALWIGSIYRNYLGQQVQGIGYKIREKKIEGKGYSFELEGYTDKDIEEFSTRHKQISEAKNKGLGDREAWYTTRKGKEEEISLGELFEKTITRKAEIGCTGQSFPTSMNMAPIGKTDAKAIVNSAIAHLSRGSCRFSQADILAQAFDHIERVRLKDVEQEIATHPELVDYGVIRGIDELKGQYTTAATLERETRIIKRWMRGQGQANPIMDKATSAEAIARLEVIYKIEWQQSHDLKLQELRAKITDGDTSKRTAKKLQSLEKEEFKGLNKGQLGAVQGILATHNNNAIVYGLSGVGKTKSLRPTKDILDELGIDTVWLAPSLAAVETLTKDVGKQAYTLQRLAYTDSIKLKPGQIIFVDEFGLADAECTDLASAKAKAAGARLIGIGDHKQNQPIQAGSPMRSLMDHGAEVFKISEILRQQDPIQKRAVELIAHGLGAESIALLSEHGYVTEIQDPDQRQEAIAAQALGMSLEDFKNTLFITGTNAERLALTEKIRQGQKDAGILGKSLDCTQLEDSRLSPEQLTDLRNYAIGDYVAPIRDYAKVKRHEFCKVIGKTETHLILELPTGSTFELEPDCWDKKLYTAGTINVAVGDELRLRGNIHGKDFQNGQIYTVKEIEGTIATLQGQKGKTRTIDLSRPVPIDHNIVRTAYDVQGSGKEGAILSLTDDRTSNQGSTYVGISRQFLFLTIYTQNYDALLKRVSRECTHDNALDLLELFDHGSRTRDSATTQTTHNPDSGSTGAEQGTESLSQRGNEHSADHGQGRTAKLPDPVHGGIGESGAIEDGGGNQGAISHPQGTEGAANQLGVDSRGHDGSGQLRDGRDQDIQRETTQPIQWGQACQQLIQGLDAIADDQLVHESSVLDLTREVVESLDQIVAPPEPTATQPHQYPGISRAVEVLVDGDDAQLVAQVGIVEEVKDVINQLDKIIEPNIQTNLEQIGEQYVGQNNSSESSRTTRDSARDAGDKRTGKNTNGTGVRHVEGESRSLSRDKGENRRGGRRNGESGQEIAEASGRQERHLSIGGAIGQNGGGGFRDSEPDRTKVRSPDRVDPGISGLQAIADEIVRIRLQQELAAPLARLASKLEELKELKRLNAEKQARNVAGFQQFLAQAKVEVLDTTLSEWRSLRQEPDVFELPEQAVAISDKAALSELIESYPAQKAIEFAMAEYSYASNQVIDLETSLKTGIPVFRLDELLAGSLSNKSKEVDRPVTQTIDRPQKQRPVNVEQRNAIRTLTRPEPPNKRTQKPSSTAPKPTKFEAFWVPDYSEAVRPEHIELKHWLEMQESGIHPDITTENVRSVDGQTALRYLLEEKLGGFKGESDQYATTPVKNILNRYENLLEGGWWSGSGVDPKTLGSQVKEREWGAFKPDNPRLSVKKPLLSYRWQGEIADEVKEFRANTESMAIALLMESGINANQFMEFKTIKYEHPPGPNRGLFLPKVPDDLAQKIYAKYGITPTQEELKDGFWGVVKAYPQIPIVLNEGYKKTAATTSQGFAAAGAAGINGFYRANDENDRPLILRELHPDLAVFAVPGREFIIALDEDDKTSTIWDVRRDSVRTAELLEDYGSTCKVAHWGGAKGNDDLIVRQGPAVYIKALNKAEPIEGEKRIWYRAEYNKIATQVRRDHPGISAKDLEVEAFLVARGKGDAKDCDRFMSQADNIRKLENPSEYLSELRAIATQDKQDNRLIAQPEAIQESLLWLDLIIARYGTEDEDLVLGDWSFTKEGANITAIKDGVIGLEKRNGLVIKFAPELQGQLKTAIAAMQPEKQRAIDNSFEK